MAPELGEKIGTDPFQASSGFVRRETMGKIGLEHEYDVRKW
jgi:hypothetical protein